MKQTKTPLEYLQAAPESINLALSMAHDLKRRELAGTLDLLDLIPMAEKIERAAEVGIKLIEETERALQVLVSAEGVPAQIVPAGF